MNELLEIVASNCVVALALAVVVAGISRLRVNPNIVHVLWLMVLVKFFTPPLWQVDLSWPEDSRDTAVEEVVISAEPQMLIAVGPPPVSNAPPESVPDPVLQWAELLLAIWAIGVVVFIGVTLLRVGCIRSLLRRATPAPLELIQIAEGLCQRLGVRRCPPILLLPVRISPAVWSLSAKPRLLLPAELARDMNGEQLETILAHELAHIRRGDHLVRLLELAVTTAFWWNPVVWWVRRNLREMEEHCCDALVLETLPDSARRYAIALIETVEFLSNQSGRLPIGATAAKPTVTLTRRIQMLKHGSHVRRLSAKGLIAMFAVLIVPMTLAFAQDDSKATELKTKVYRLKDLDAQSVEKTILEKVAPGEWDKDGGLNTIKQTSKGLVITAGPEVHQQIALVLELQKLIKRQAELEQQLKVQNTKVAVDAQVELANEYQEYQLEIHNLYDRIAEKEKADVDLQLHGYLRTPELTLYDREVTKSCTHCHNADVHSHPVTRYHHPPDLSDLGKDRKALEAWLKVVVPAQPQKQEEEKTQEKPDADKAAIWLEGTKLHLFRLPREGSDAAIYFYESSDSREPRRIRYRLLDPDVAPKDSKNDPTQSTDQAAQHDSAASGDQKDGLKSSRVLGIELRTGKVLGLEVDPSKSLKESPKKAEN